MMNQLARHCLQSSARRVAGRGPASQSDHVGNRLAAVLALLQKQRPGQKRMSSSTIDTTASASTGRNLAADAGKSSRQEIAATSSPSGTDGSSSISGSVKDDGSSVDGSSFRSVYVHPLSQVILEYLQDVRHDWAVERGLDRALTVHRDGSFESRFFVRSGPAEEVAGGTNARAEEMNNNGGGDGGPVPRIWTSYDAQEKKHWLTVHKGPLHQRFLLQDNLVSAWHGNRTSLPERIQSAVEEMIGAVDRLEGGGDQRQRRP